MEKIEARGGGSGKEWARGGRKTAAFTAYMRNKSDIFTEVTSAGGGIWTLAKGISADKAREKLEPRHLPSRAARRQRSSGAEGDDDDDDDYDEEEEEDYGREKPKFRRMPPSRTQTQMEEVHGNGRIPMVQ